MKNIRRENRPLVLLDGWVKKAQNVNGVEIHYNYNELTGKFDDFKFK